MKNLYNLNVGDTIVATGADRGSYYYRHFTNGVKYTVKGFGESKTGREPYLKVVGDEGKEIVCGLYRFLPVNEYRENFLIGDKVKLAYDEFGRNNTETVYTVKDSMSLNYKVDGLSNWFSYKQLRYAGPPAASILVTKTIQEVKTGTYGKTTILRDNKCGHVFIKTKTLESKEDIRDLIDILNQIAQTVS